MKNLVKIVKLSLAAVGVLSIVSTSISAEGLPAKSILPFASYDKNQDGFVSKSEFIQVNSARASAKETQGMPLMHSANAPDFGEYDADKDGQLSESEFLKSCKHCHVNR
ncbi:MAG: EF-hand domain-containing protein [Sulfurimonas sp.]|jgi:Ca2+-binding EF-hand superfamily protein